MSLVLRTTDGPVAVLSLNRPDKRNAMIPEVQRELIAMLGNVAADETVGAVVITGEGGDFCVGGDRAVVQRMQTDASFYDELAQVHAAIADAILSFAKPTIAAVNGRAFGFGAELAAFCDMVVMGEEACFADPHVKLGMGPAPGALLIWPQLTSRMIAAELLLTGREIGAEEALRLGLANRITPEGEALAGALELAHGLCKLPREGVLAVKRKLRRSYADMVAAAGGIEKPPNAL